LQEKGSNRVIAGRNDEANQRKQRKNDIDILDCFGLRPRNDGGSSLRGGTTKQSREKNREFMIQMEYYLIISTLMFFIGIYGFITRKNMIAILISLELVLNAVEINFAVFNRYLYPEQMEGMFFALFGIAITAAETTVALAIIINAYRAIGNIEIKNLSRMKG